MTETAVSFQPFRTEFTDDPYPHYAELRAEVPVEHHELGFWALWRHADVTEMLRARLSVEDSNITNFGPMRAVYDEIYREADRGRRGEGLSMLDRDPPDHTRLRRLVSRAFTPRTIETLTPVIQSLVDDALDRIADGGEVDLIETLAFPLPFAVISTMLGMPETDVTRLARAVAPDRPVARTGAGRADTARDPPGRHRDGRPDPCGDRVEARAPGG